MRRLWSTLLLLLSSAAVEAAVLDVYPDGSGPYPDLDHALMAAQSGDSLRLADGIFTGSGNRNLVLGGALTILSMSGDPENCILDLEGDGRGFFIYSAPGTAIRIQGITLRGGDPRLLPQEFLTGYGGGLAVKGLAPGGRVVIDRCIFEGNTADAGGGAFLYQAEAAFVACVFRGNHATDGAGGYAGYCSAGDGVQFSTCLFHGNDYPYPSVGGYGAGVYFSHSRGGVELCTMAENRAWFGGGLLVSTASVVRVEGVLIAFSAEGQALALNAGTVAIVRCDFFGNDDGDWTGPIAGYLGVDCNVREDPIFCGQADADFTVRGDSPCLPENNGCGLIGAFLQGCAAPCGSDAWSGLASGSLELAPPLPMPCHGPAMVTFALPGAGRVRLRLIDLQGRVRATLVDGLAAAGVHRVAIGDAVGARGHELAAGVYLIRLEFAGETRSRRLVVLR